MDTAVGDLNTTQEERDVSTEFSQGVQKEGNSKIRMKRESILNQFS